MELRFVVPNMEKTFGNLEFAGENTTEQQRINGRMAVINRSYNLYSDVQRADDVVVVLPAKAGEKHFSPEQKVKLINPRITTDGYKIGERGFVNYDIVRTTSVRRLNKLYFTYTDLSPEVQQAYKELIPYCGGVEDLLQKSEEFLFYPECHNIMDVARYRLEHNIEFSALSEKGKKYFNLEAYAHELEEKGRYALCNNGMFKL